MVTDGVKKKLFSLLDLTRLHDNDTAESITTLCQRACELQVAAVCVYPSFVTDAVHALKGTSIKVATVVNFPDGTDTLETILTTIKQSLTDGAEEIDIVFPYRRYLEEDTQAPLDIIKSCKRLASTLKVILETGVISDLSMIERISKEVIAAGADFLKTSTGKVSVGATLDAARAMLHAIKASGHGVGFKASGGIRTYEQALQYIQLAKNIMGVNWITPQFFRIGTSGIL